MDWADINPQQIEQVETNVLIVPANLRNGWIDVDGLRVDGTFASSKEESFNIPPLLKILFKLGLEENSLEGIRNKSSQIDDLRKVLHETRAILDEGVTKSNYKRYFHHLLWWEETIEKMNLMKYNMQNVYLEHKQRNRFILVVPGVAEKRPSLLRGDMVFIQPKSDLKITFTCCIKRIDGNEVHLGDLTRELAGQHTPQTKYIVRFMSLRGTIEYTHEAVERLFTSQQDCRVFPVRREGCIAVQPINRFYNRQISSNEEQRRAVEHIVAGSSGKAPYILFGPPGTGKTMTIVEAILQIVASNPCNKVMVCTNSNMAADHIALVLLKYKKYLNCSHFILRVNSDSRDWSVMPKALKPISIVSGQMMDNRMMKSQTALQMIDVRKFRIVVSTLMHAAKYGFSQNTFIPRLVMSHLFIDEAAQALEPHCLIPITGLLSAGGQLVLAGDPQQLGPVCMSREAARRGLGLSLLERLIVEHANLYEQDPSYMTMLVKNFRSDGDILKLPNQLFYKDKLIAMAPPDPISKVSILGHRGGKRAIVFHSVHSEEQKMGNAPSYFNEMELDILKKYLIALINIHKVAPEDIGIIAPYIRQVCKIKAWLVSRKYPNVEVGTVEAFQGKEKRVLLVSTVRSNDLGFLVDDKRFNVTLTRAKAKIIIIGNPSCLTRDIKWNLYMEQCKEINCYLEEDEQQLPRTTRERCSLSEALKEKLAITED